MGKMNVNFIDVPGIVGRLPVQGPKSGVVYQATSSTGGILTIPDEYMSVASDPTAGLASYLGSYAATIRYNHETAGITLNGAAIATDRDSQNLINGAVNLLINDPTVTQINFKSSSGAWIQIPAAQMITIGVAVGNYVQACFNAERDIDAAVTAGTITTTADIDNYAWPPTTITTSSTNSGATGPIGPTGTTGSGATGSTGGTAG